MATNTIIYTSKKTGAVYTLTTTEINEAGKTIYVLTSRDDHTDVIRTTESVLKRWYKKEAVVDLTNVEEHEEPFEAETTDTETTESVKAEEVPAKKTKKTRKPRAKTYEDQKWGLVHTRMSFDTFCEMLDLSSMEYDNKNHKVLLYSGSELIATRRAWENEITGSVWFRYKNAEFEITDMDYESGVIISELEENNEEA